VVDELAEMKAQVYKDLRPKEYFDRFHTRARTRRPDWVYDLVRTVLGPLMWTAYRARSIGSVNVPASGPVILAPNHFSFLDHFFLAIFIRRRVRFMAKSQLFKRPAQWIFFHGGVFPVRRGHRDEEAFVTAETILGQGGCVGMYCEGGRSRTGRLAARARPGIGRLALESGAAIVPIAIYGSQRARNWKRLQFPKVTIQYGTPFRFERVERPTRGQQLAAAEEIFTEIKRLYGALERHGRRGVLQRLRAERRAGGRALTA
jgi:1-acyl-sn-glycerol-3-phosphate acyltransferase